jgi:predicted DNA-binding transcriptional regulator YafY
MNRIDRLYAMVTVLQSRRVVRAEDLAARFNISVRTVYRDLKSLEESGIPIGAEAGIGYYLMEGFHLPPVMFSHEEARALLVAGKFMEQYSDLSSFRSFEDALVKVRAVLSMDKKDEMESLEKRIIVLPKSPVPGGPGELHLNIIKQALVSNRVLSIEYFTPSSQEITARTIEPVGLCFYSDKWHLIAYCRLRQDYRDFRLDRISKLKSVQEIFLRVKHPVLHDYLNNLSKNSEIKTVEIEVDQSVHRYIENDKYQMGLLHESPKETTVQMTFGTCSINYFAHWLMMLGEKVNIISPQELKEIMKEISGAVYEKYNNNVIPGI